jgi:hypothetical protein
VAALNVFYKLVKCAEASFCLLFASTGILPMHHHAKFYALPPPAIHEPSLARIHFGSGLAQLCHIRLAVKRIGNLKGSPPRFTDCLKKMRIAVEVSIPRS